LLEPVALGSSFFCPRIGQHAPAMLLQIAHAESYFAADAFRTRREGVM
jgi:hypothetical protein